MTELRTLSDREKEFNYLRQHPVSTAEKREIRIRLDEHKKIKQILREHVLTLDRDYASHGNHELSHNRTLRKWIIQFGNITEEKLINECTIFRPNPIMFSLAKVFGKKSKGVDVRFRHKGKPHLCVCTMAHFLGKTYLLSITDGEVKK